MGGREKRELSNIIDKTAVHHLKRRDRVKLCIKIREFMNMGRSVAPGM
jgi:hypothetical protein